MLEGREISEVWLSKTLENKDFRTDSDFYTKAPKVNPNLKYVSIGSILKNSQYGISIEMNEEGKGYPIYRMNEIHNMLCDFEVNKCADISFSEFQKFELNDKDVLFNRTNSYEWVGRTGIYRKQAGKDFTFASYLVRFVPDENIVLPEYLTTFLNTKFGVWDIKRRARHSINQTNVNPEEVKAIQIPLFSLDFQYQLKDYFDKAYQNLEQSKTLYTEAENLLLESLDLKDFDFEKEKVSTNIKSFSQSFLSTGRLDAEYYQPKYEILENKIRSYEGGVMLLSEIAYTKRGSLISEDFYDYEIGTPYIRGADISSGILENSKMVYINPRFKHTTETKVKKDDICFALIGSVGTLALVTENFDNSFISNNIGLIRLKSNIILADVLHLILINKQIGKLYFEQKEMRTAQPKISDKDIQDFLIPILPQETQTLISSKIQESFRLKSESEALLSLAKEVVEIAIEISEEKALQKIQDMTQKIYVLPAKIDLHYFSNLLLAIETQQAPKITLDWSSCVSIDKQSYCSILHLRDIIAIKNAELSHLGEDTITYQKVKHIFEYDLNNNSDIFSGIFISPIQSEELILQHQRLMENFYSKHTKGYDLTSLGNIFQELYMNVCQHSEVSKGYIFMANPDENGNCEMIFSDKGIGIVDKICNFFVDETFETDAKVIEYATQKGVTTRSQTQNQGKGLDNLVVQAESLKASLCIYSKQGIFKKIIKDITLLDNPLLYKGTLIYLSFNICNLPLQEDDNLVGEL